MKYRILTLNNISARGLERLPRDRYEVASGLERPDAILVRSADMHGAAIPDTVRAVGRAGAGVNNIPVADLSGRGIAVFNAPGANANAVKELVLTSLLLAARNVCQAWAFARSLSGDDQAIDEAVEKGKKAFVGFELPGRTLGVVGLGAVGVEVANSAEALGMSVLGYDPQITVQRAWQLSSSVEQALSLDDLFARSDVVTVHVPLNDQTRRLVNESRLRLMKQGCGAPQLPRAAASSTTRPSWADLDAGHLHGLRLRLPDQTPQGSSEDRHTAAPRRLDRRGRGELRHHGGRPGARLPGERQHPQQRQLPGSGAVLACPAPRASP